MKEQTTNRTGGSRAARAAQSGDSGHNAAARPRVKNRRPKMRTKTLPDAATRPNGPNSATYSAPTMYLLRFRTRPDRCTAETEPPSSYGLRYLVALEGKTIEREMHLTVYSTSNVSGTA